MAENLKRTDLINAIEEQENLLILTILLFLSLRGMELVSIFGQLQKKFLMLQSKKLTKMIERLIG